MKFFKYKHLPESVRDTSKLFGELAKTLEQEIPHNAEKSAGMRKLLEAKDCFVRAKLDGMM